MKFIPMFLIILVLVMVVLALAGCGKRGAGNNGKPRTGLTTATPLWEVELTLVNASAVISEDVALLFGADTNADNVIVAVDVATGAQRWKLSDDAGQIGVTARLVGRQGNTLVFSWEGFDRQMHLIGVDAESGAIAWQQDVAKEQGYIFGYPSLDDGRILLFYGYSSLVTFDAATGAEQWWLTLPEAHIFDDSRTDTPKVLAYSDIRNVVSWALRSDGMMGRLDYTAQTTETLPIAFADPAPDLTATRNATVFWLSDETLLVRVEDTLIALDPATLTERWRQDGFLTKPIIHEQGGLFFTDEYTAYDEQTGEVVWSRPVQARARGAASAQFADDAGLLVEPRRDTVGVNVLSLTTGEAAWSLEVPDVAPLSLYTDIFVDGSRLVVGTQECGEPTLDPCPEVEASVFAYDLTTQALLWRYTATEASPRAIGSGVVVLQVDGQKFVGMDVE